MKQKDKRKILKQLSRSESAKAASALEKEFENAEKLLSDTTDYYQLKETLEELSIYGHRVADGLIVAVSGLLERLQKAEFVTCEPDLAWSSPAEMQLRLTIEALELIQLFRFFNTIAVVETFLHFSEHDDQNVATTAIDGLKKSAAYDIDIFYVGESRAGLGATPQLEIISYLEANLVKFAHQHIKAVQCLCGELLSPTMEGTSWDYKTVTLSSGAIPVCDATIEVRRRTINFLKKIYHAERPVPERISLIRTVMTSMEVPRRPKYGDDLKNMITSDSLEVLNWLASLVYQETFPVLQKIEHDVYWRYYHGISDDVMKSCLAIRDALHENVEYQIYRNLIGFESIFEDWEQSLTSERDYSSIDNERRQKASEYVHEINENNWSEWKERIFEFCKTESRDLATFPIFYEFLEEFAELRPKFAFELASEHLDQVERFTIPIYRGLWRTSFRDECRALAMWKLIKSY